MRILVIGATGRIGRHVVDALRDRSADVRALTRDPVRASFDDGVEVVAGDLTVPASLERPLDGADGVFIVWTAPPATMPAVAERLASCGHRVVLLSSPHQTRHPFFQQPNPMARLHAALEAALREHVPGATIVRPGMFASNTVGWWGATIRRAEVVRWPYMVVETAPIDERDIAAVVATSLLEPGHAGKDYVVTGPEALSHRAQLQAISAAIGRAIATEELTPDTFRAQMAATWPPVALDMLLSAWQATVGVPAYVTSSVQDVTGSPARTFGQWAADHRALFLE